MKKILLLAITAFSLALTANVWAGGDINAGKVAVESHGCTACHGVDFNSPIDPSYPKLAGQHQEYLEHALVAYRRGGGVANGRVNAIMNGQAKPLTDKEIADITAYISSLPGNLIVQK
jgi:cytochrome c553